MNSQTYNILHLETSLLYKKIIKEICAEISAKHRSAENIEAATQILEKEKISLIITAMEIEGGNSINFIKAVNETVYNHIPIVVFTGNDSLESRISMYELGIVDYILKSTGREQIKENILSFQREEPVSIEMRNLTYAVLDDNKMDRKIVERIFSMFQICNVKYFESEKQLIDAGETFNVYIIDIVLKETTGDKVIINIKDKHPDSIVIAVSGIDNVKTISRILSSGADDYITKPFNYELFISRLKTNVRNYILLKEVRIKNEQLANMAITDSLTGLYNRGHFFERLAQETEKKRRYGSAFSLLMFDIDHFKKINDAYGHPFGDEILVKVAAAITSSIRTIDIAGRYGGEEFVVITPENGIEASMIVAERIRENVEAIDTGIKNLTITISGGAAEQTDGDPGSLINTVDLLLYKAKRNGRNRVEY